MKAHLTTQTIWFATDRLTALAQAKGAVPQEIPEILFICKQNAGRSQMATVITSALSGGRVHVRSAGSMPAAELNPSMVTGVTELGLDVSEEFPKPLTDDVVQAADIVITMGCGDACPIHPGKTRLDWNLRDPAGLPLEDVREIRNQITIKVEGMLSDLHIESAGAGSWVTRR